MNKVIAANKIEVWANNPDGSIRVVPDGDDLVLLDADTGEVLFSRFGSLNLTNLQNLTSHFTFSEYWSCVKGI